MPDGLLARVKEALAGKETVNGFIVAAIEERLERREGGSTAPAAKPRDGSTTRKLRADTSPPARFQPESAESIAAYFKNRNQGGQ